MTQSGHLGETLFWESLRAFTQDLCARYRDWARQEAEHRRARDAALAATPFPFDGYRAGQRELTEAVFRSQRAGRHLLAQAPTGIGKTVATLFGALRAMPVLGSDQLLVLTPKTTGRAIALDGLRRRTGVPGSLGTILEQLLYPETVQKLASYFEGPPP